MPRRNGPESAVIVVDGVNTFYPSSVVKTGEGFTHRRSDARERLSGENGAPVLAANQSPGKEYLDGNVGRNKTHG